MLEQRRRHIVTTASRLGLGRHVLLRRDPLRGKWVVLAPEKVLWPDNISVDILGRCDGARTVGEIIEDLTSDYSAPREVIAPDVLEFLQDWCDRQLISPDPVPSSRRPAAPSLQPFPEDGDASSAAPPLGLLAELTHRCPLQCGYCSNPLELLKANQELCTETWISTFEQAADLGVLQVHLSGGEPTLRRDLEDIIACLSSRGVYTNLITAAVTLTRERLQVYREAGLDHVQVSFQGARPKTTDLVGHYKNAHEKKRQVAAWVRELGLPLTINAPIHKLNIHEVPEFVDLALELGAERLEIANVQYYGWAYLNRAALLPGHDEVMRQVDYVERAQDALTGILNIDFVTPDYYADYPKPCMGGWGKDAFVITPDGHVLPCHAAQSITALRFDKVTERPLRDIWEQSEAFNRFRGFDWMPEPCRSCARKEIDFGGCRCQAFAMTGDAAATDPTCIKSPYHHNLRNLPDPTPLRKRVIGGTKSLGNH